MLDMAASDLDALKLHRRTLVLDGRACTVLTPRPTQRGRFATNSFHGTWHVLTSPPGARLLARLMWAMSFQRRPHTFLLIDLPLIVTNPFDADPSSPIVVVNSDLGGPSRAGLDQLEALLPLRSPSGGTVKVRTDGLKRAMGEEVDGWQRRLRDKAIPAHRRRHWIDVVNDVLVLAAAPLELRAWAEVIFATAARVDEDRPPYGPDASFADYEGEVQVFYDFTARVKRAAETRRKLFPGREHAQLLDAERRVVWAALHPPPSAN